jgi:excisionase family DNA binding protein
MTTAKLLTTSAAADALGVTAQTIRRWIEAGQIKAVALPSGHFRIPQSEIDRLLGAAA